MAKRRKRSPQYVMNLGLGLVVLMLFGATGYQVASHSSAITTNPYGYIDFCVLENGQTAIYGWGADPNATSLTQPSVVIQAGSKSVTAPTNRAGYHDTDINFWIDHHRAGDPKPGTYGFRAAFDGLYKGTNYSISGAALNEGVGSNTALVINTDHYDHQDTSHPFFAGNVIPAACLNDPPAAPAPPAAAPSRPATRPAPAAALSSNADATISVGTLATELKIPSGNSTAVHVLYGLNPTALDQSTTDTPTGGSDATVVLTGLQAATSYYFQIVRTNGSQTTTSTATKFDTLGYNLALHFVDNQHKGIEGLPVTIASSDDKVTTNDDGTAQFSNVPEGDLTVSYTYKNKRYTQTVTLSYTSVDPAKAEAATAVTVDFTVNVEKVATKPAAKSSDGGGGATAWVVVILAAIALTLVGLTLLWRRRRAGLEDYAYDLPLSSEADADMPAIQEQGFAEAQPEASQPAPTVAAPPTVVPPIPAPTGAEHIGESLKEMVMRSMAEEAARRRSDNHKKE